MDKKLSNTEHILSWVNGGKIYHLGIIPLSSPINFYVDIFYSYNNEGKIGIYT